MQTMGEYEDEFSDDPDRPSIRIPNRRSRGGRASHTQSTTTGNKGRTSSMASSTGGSGVQPGDESNVFAGVCLLFAVLAGSYISNNNTRLQHLIDDLNADMKRNNAAIERLENDVRLFISRGPPEKDNCDETDTETNQDVIYLKSDVEELKHITTGLDQRMHTIVSMKRIEPTMFNKWATTLAIILIVVLQAGSIVAIYVLCKGQGYGMGDGQAVTVYGPRNNKDRDCSTQTASRKRNPILNRIPRDRPLQRLVCIISLESSTRALHEQITHAVLTGLRIQQLPEVRELLVSSNDDMLRIPAATVNLLFIHFSERHVILEQPGMALDDRHVTTFQAVRQIGGGLAIVYVRDPESERLQDNYLYNRNIPVAESPELQRLCDDDAFFSTYDRLTQHQTASLQRFITEYVDKY